MYKKYPPKKRRKRIPRWIFRYALPLLLCFWILNLLFPAQLQSVRQTTDAYLLEPFCESVLDPYLFDPIQDHLLDPLQENILTPIDQTIGVPLRKWIITPVSQHLLQPLASTLSDCAQQYLLEPFRTQVLDPLTLTVQQTLEANFFQPLGLTAPWRSSGSEPIRITDGIANGSSDFQVHFLDVGQGLSILVRSGEHALLYDGGDSSASSFVVSYLKQQGITQLDYLIASHYDADHISGLIGVLHTVSVQTVIGPDYEHTSKTYASFQSAVRSLGLTVEHPAVGTEYLLGDAYFTILSPDKTYEDSNNNSVAIRIVNGENSFLFSGDAETESEEAMCQSNLVLYSDVICPGHHGSSNATSRLFLSYTQPTWAVISVGSDNDYGHPHWETLQRLEDCGTTVYRTDQLGTIIAYSDGQTITWNV